MFIIYKETSNTQDIAGVQIECVDHFKYIGSIKTDNADPSKDVNARIRMAKKRTHLDIKK